MVSSSFPNPPLRDLYPDSKKFTWGIDRCGQTSKSLLFSSQLSRESLPHLFSQSTYNFGLALREIYSDR